MLIDYFQTFASFLFFFIFHVIIPDRGNSIIPGLGRRKRSLDALEDIVIEDAESEVDQQVDEKRELETDTEAEMKRETEKETEMESETREKLARSLDDIFDEKFTEEEVAERFKRQVRHNLSLYDVNYKVS